MFVRNLALCAMMLVGAAGVAAAQSTPAAPTRPDSGMYRRGTRADGEFRGRKGGREFYADLNLTDAQKTQIKAIRDKYKAQFQSIRTQEQNEIRNVLTPEQRTKLEARQKEMADRRGKWGKGRKGVAPQAKS